MGEEDGKATAEMENKAKRAELDGIMNALDAERAQSGEIMERISQSEQRLLEVSAQHDEFQKKLEEERNNMKKMLKEAKDRNATPDAGDARPNARKRHVSSNVKEQSHRTGKRKGGPQRRNRKHFRGDQQTRQEGTGPLG